MFYKKPFVVVLIISLGWHLFWMLAVSVVILPGHLTPGKYKPINFLGPLFKEIVITSGHPNHDAMETIAANLHPEAEENISLKLKLLPEISPEIKEEKEIPDLLTLISYATDSITKEEVGLDQNIKYQVYPNGEAGLLNRLITSSNPEDDILKMRSIWLSHVYSLN